MNSIEKIQLPIKEEMAKFEKIFKASTKSKVALLNIITRYILSRKGNQTRRMFVFLSAKLNGTVTNDTYTAASLIELLHTATLIHDDVADESYDKKGFFSIKALWQSKIAVLMGDYLLSKGLLLSVENRAFDLLGLVSEAIKEMSEGELLRIYRSRTMNITEEQYLEIVRRKKAPLISVCLAGGAKSAGSNNDAIKRMTLLGEYIGLSFQIKEDLFNYKLPGYSKRLTNNMIEKKLSLPLIYALHNSSKTEKNLILTLINSNVKNSKKIETVGKFITQNGGLEYASTMMYNFRDKALSLLVSYPESEAKSSLAELINFTIERNK